MGTRCQIGFYKPEVKDLGNFEALIYRHWDGNPESVIPSILPILQDFKKNRGLDDVEYASAWLVAKLKEDYLNIGICRVFHSDIEWFYAVYPARIIVYQVTNSDCDTWREFEIVKI